MKKHPGYYALICIVTGIVAADLTAVSIRAIMVVASIAALVGWAALALKRPYTAAAAFGLVLMALSSFGYAVRVYAFGPDHLDTHVTFGDRYRIVGSVDDWPTLKTDRTDLTVAVDTIESDRTQALSGRLLIRIDDTTTAVEQGDRIELYGQIYPVPAFRSGGGFDYGRYLRLRSVAGLVYLKSAKDIRIGRGSRWGPTHLVDRLRTIILESLRTHLDPVSAALAAGFLIGETRDIPPDLYRRFRDSGTLHLLAVSGSNVALVLLFAMVLLRPFRIGRRPRAFVLLAVVGLFTMLSYEQPSVLRAAVMASLVIVGRLVERRIDLNHIVAVAAVIILLAAPTQLFDIGFQLSFVTAWGLIFATPRVYALLPEQQNRRWFRWLALPLSVAVIAQLFSTPLVVLYFQRIPLISPLANLVIVPLVSIAVVGVMIVLVAALVLPPLAGLLGSLLDQLMHAIDRCLVFFTHGQIPLVETGSLPTLAAVAAYAGLVLLFVAIQSRSARRSLGLAAAIALVLVLGETVRPTLFPVNAVDLTVSSVPGGIATVIESKPDNTADLILTGLAAKDYPVGERVIRPLLRRCRVSRLRSIVLLTADYNALEYIARLADSLGVQRVYLHQRLAGSWADFVRFSRPAPAAPVVLFGGTATSIVNDHLSLDGSGVRLRLTGGEVLIADPRVASPLPLSKAQSLLILDNRRANLHDCLALLGPDRFDWVICAKIAQRKVDPAVPFPPRLIELSRIGEIRVRIDRERQNSMKVFGLD